jgi:tetratricopeptide (TPR) repeat protein
LDEDSLKEWTDSIDGFDTNNLATFYTKIFKKRFELEYRLGYEELQGYMDSAKPSVGYTFLAQILDETDNKFVITTNFDTMTEDALFEVGETKPLVLGHEVLSKFINSHSPMRPTIIKIHRDFLFDPYNREEDTNKLDEQWQEPLKPILLANSMIVLGYGGNDNSLMDYLQKIDNRKPIYWCYRKGSTLPDKVKELLSKKDFIVEISGFDKFMLLLSDKLDFQTLVDKENIKKSKIVTNAITNAKRYAKQLEELAKEELDSNEEQAIKKLLPSWGSWQIEINKESDSNEQDKMYIDGIKDHPNSHELIENYAIFLSNIKKDYEKAEEYYKKALELEPNSATKNGNYAFFLHEIKKDYEKAEEYHKKALELEPDSANNNGNYAQFLLQQGKKKDAEQYIAMAFKNHTEDFDVTIELWFYRFAHYSEYFNEAKKELDRLLEKKVRSIGWNFDANIARAKADGFKDIELLKSYASRITEE